MSFFTWADLLLTVGTLAYHGTFLLTAGVTWGISRSRGRPFPWGGIPLAVAVALAGSVCAFLTVGSALYPAVAER